MRCKRWAAQAIVVTLMSWMSVVAVGNVPAPHEDPPVRRKVLVRQSNDHNYRIVIPRSVLKELKVALGELDVESREPESSWRHRSVLAALALSAGMISLVLVRRRGTATRVAIVLIVGGATYLTSTAYADLGPPFPRPTQRPATKPDPRAPLIQIETTRQRHAVILYVPAEKPQAAKDRPPESGGADDPFGPNAGGVGGPPPDATKRKPTTSRPK